MHFLNPWRTPSLVANSPNTGQSLEPVKMLHSPLVSLWPIIRTLTISTLQIPQGHPIVCFQQENLLIWTGYGNSLCRVILQWKGQGSGHLLQGPSMWHPPDSWQLRTKYKGPWIEEGEKRQIVSGHSVPTNWLEKCWAHLRQLHSSHIPFACVHNTQTFSRLCNWQPFHVATQGPSSPLFLETKSSIFSWKERTSPSFPPSPRCLRRAQEPSMLHIQQAPVWRHLPWLQRDAWLGTSQYFVSSPTCVPVFLMNYTSSEFQKGPQAPCTSDTESIYTQQ